MKTRIFTICIMVAALAMFAPVAEAGLYKVAGGGVIEFIDTEGEANLAISARYDGDALEWSGNVMYNDHDTKFKFHGTVSFIIEHLDSERIVIVARSKDLVIIEITIFDDGIEDEVIDELDKFKIFSYGDGSYSSSGYLVRGNIKLFFDED